MSNRERLVYLMKNTILIYLDILHLQEAKIDVPNRYRMDLRFFSCPVTSNIKDIDRSTPEVYHALEASLVIFKTMDVLSGWYSVSWYGLSSPKKQLLVDAKQQSANAMLMLTTQDGVLDIISHMPHRHAIVMKMPLNAFDTYYAELESS